MANITGITTDQQYVFTGAGLQALAGKTYSSTPFIDSDHSTTTLILAKNSNNNGSQEWSSGPKYITLRYGDGNLTVFPVGSEIVFQGGVSKTDQDTQATGTFRVKVDGNTLEVPINGLAGGSGAAITLTGDLLPATDNIYDIGSPDADANQNGNQPKRWRNLYLSGNLGSSTYPVANAYITNLILGGSISSSGKLSISDTSDGINGTTRNSSTHVTTLPSGTITGNTNASIYTQGGIYAVNNIYGERMFNAVFNDYAEYRTTINLTPGHVVIDQDDGSLICSTARLQPGAQVISDTFGHAMGQTFEATTPIAVAGRVLVYTYQSRENYHAGMAVCSAPDGTVDIMTREEIRDYPDCIVGIVSEIPEYETWGSDNVKVDGRIWVRIK